MNRLSIIIILLTLNEQNCEFKKLYETRTKLEHKCVEIIKPEIEKCHQKTLRDWDCVKVTETDEEMVVMYYTGTIVVENINCLYS